MHAFFLSANLFIWLLASSTAHAQAHKPQFNDYPVAGHYTGQRVAPKLIPGTAAWHFRTRIREAAQRPPNFAGHYVLATWGCGAECLSTAIVDVQSGAVYFDDMTTCCWFNAHAAEIAKGLRPIDFRLDSRLVIFTGLLNEEGQNGPHYFRFERGKLLSVR